MKPALKFRTIVLSDVHLGTPDCKIDEVNHFLKHTRSETLILNGDIIDVWSLSRKGGWTKAHTRFIRKVLKLIEKRDTRVVYLRGNHDDILSKVLPLSLDNLTIGDAYIHESPAGRYLVIHGDVFDTVITHSKALAILGDIGYQWLLRLNRVYQLYRNWRGLGYYSISKAIKARVKSAVSHISRFEEHIQKLARKHGCNGVICGHIHTPEDKRIGGVHYLNSGDWVESLTALVEHEDGRFEILTYAAFCHRLAEVAGSSAEPHTLSDETEPDWSALRFIA